MIDAFLRHILGRKDIHPAARLVVLELADKQRTNKHCRVSSGFLAKRIGMANSTVRLSLQELLEKRLITRKYRKLSATEQDITEYSVVWVNNWNRKVTWLRAEKERTERGAA